MQIPRYPEQPRVSPPKMSADSANHLYIEKLSRGDVFSQHPQLCGIWPEKYTSVAAEATTDCFALNESGLFLVKQNSAVVGVTGYWPFNGKSSKKETELGLRWHGLIPSVRGKGHSRKIIHQLLLAAEKTHPNAKTLIELVPVDAYGAALIPLFTALGFCPVGETETHDWMDHAWQPYHLSIPNFLLTEKNRDS